MIFRDFSLFLHFGRFLDFSGGRHSSIEAVEGLSSGKNGNFSKNLENSRFFRKNAANTKKNGLKT